MCVCWLLLDYLIPFWMYKFAHIQKYFLVVSLKRRQDNSKKKNKLHKSYEWIYMSMSLSEISIWSPSKTRLVADDLVVHSSLEQVYSLVGLTCSLALPMVVTRLEWNGWFYGQVRCTWVGFRVRVRVGLDWIPMGTKPVYGQPSCVEGDQILFPLYERSIYELVFFLSVFLIDSLYRLPLSVKMNSPNTNHTFLCKWANS